MEFVFHAKAVELAGDATTSIGEVLLVGVGPPILHVPLRVKLAALVVKSVCHFVANNRSHGPIVQGVVGLEIEKRRLENSRGKDNFV